MSKACVGKSQESFDLIDLDVEQVGVHEAPEREIFVSSVWEVFDTATVQEALVENLPKVPDLFDDKNKADEEIEIRLDSLKIFYKVLNSISDSNEKTKQKQTKQLVYF